MADDPKHLTVYLVPEDFGGVAPYDGMPVECVIDGRTKIQIGTWIRRHDTWQIRVYVPVSVEVLPYVRTH